jgi:signal transduction histidine kinase
VQVATYRIVQEALNNVTRHASAATAWVELTMELDAVHLVVGDDGCGFEPLDADPTHMGLRCTRERAEQTGAQFEYQQRAGQGRSNHGGLAVAPRYLTGQSNESRDAPENAE